MMIDYTSITKIIQSRQYVDITQHFARFWDFQHETLVNSKGTGSSLFLKTFACFLDENADTKEVFRNLAIGKDDEFMKQANTYRVLYLDFSDFDTQDFEHAKEYILSTMSDAYKHFFSHFEPTSGHIYDFNVFEHALDIIEGKPSKTTLQSSLRNLILQLRGYESHHTDKRLAVLIDNMILLETVAEQYGYSAEMSNFLESFLVADIYKYCDIFLQISDPEEEHDSWWSSDNHLVHRRFCVSYFDMRDRYPDMIVPPDHQAHFNVLPTISPSYDWESCIANGRLRIHQARLEEEKRRQERINYEKKRFAENLSSKIPLLSPNMGIRSKSLDKDAAKYKELNDLVKGIFDRFHPYFNADNIYRYFQNIQDQESIVSSHSELEAVLESLPEQNPKWKSTGWVSNTGSWIQAVYSRRDKRDNGSPAKPEGLKIYVCLKDVNSEEIFVESLKYLLSHSDEDFAAKIATCNRSDQICYWVSQRGFRVLENFYEPYSNHLVESLPFVAYRNHLGISKEFFGVDYSHNATVAHIIADYLKTVSDVTDVDLEQMFNHYIKKWNADIYEEDANSGFKNNSALSFVVILDSLDVILGNAEITDNHPLLFGDRHFWHTLADCRCWADVNEKLKMS